MARSSVHAAIELESHGQDVASSSQRASQQSSSNADSIIRASQISDSTVPDGGYGWAVIFGSGVICFWFVGTSYSWGIIQAALVKQHLSSPSTLSFVGSLTAFCIASFAIINARLIRLMGARNTAFLGISLYASGELLSGFATHSIGGLFVTAGGLMGIGTRYAPALLSAMPSAINLFHCLSLCFMVCL